ncbi:hypothetical protein E4U21_005784 [Claviceps maximensis]|nr:hypothetical protein E4U21_005784 [Claviceps maximensis]
MKTSVAILAAMPLLWSATALPVNSTKAHLPFSGKLHIEGEQMMVTAIDKSALQPDEYALLGAPFLTPTLVNAGKQGPSNRFVPMALAEKASGEAVRFQPVLDYDKDSCYNVPAIDAKGNVAQGLRAKFSKNTSEGCRDKELLDNQNVYVRSRCNHGWCAYMYEHYFEKDVGLQHSFGVASGHRHEWENIVVVVKQGEKLPSLVAVSRHDSYARFKPAERHGRHVRFQDTHAKIVYHKDGQGTHTFRFAKPDDDKLENDKGRWIRGALVEWSQFPSAELRDRMVRAFDNTGTEPKISDAHFSKYLAKAIKKKIPDFNPWQEDSH